LIGEGFKEDDLYFAYFNLDFVSGAPEGFISAIERFKDPSSMDRATCKAQCLMRDIDFNDDSWRTSDQYRTEKLRELQEAKDRIIPLPDNLTEMIERGFGGS
jgi:hypothetical protein